VAGRSSPTQRPRGGKRRLVRCGTWPAAPARSSPSTKPARRRPQSSRNPIERPHSRCSTDRCRGSGGPARGEGGGGGGGGWGGEGGGGGGGGGGGTVRPRRGSSALSIVFPLRIRRSGYLLLSTVSGHVWMQLVDYLDARFGPCAGGSLAEPAAYRRCFSPLERPGLDHRLRCIDRRVSPRRLLVTPTAAFSNWPRSTSPRRSVRPCLRCRNGAAPSALRRSIAPRPRVSAPSA